METVLEELSRLCGRRDSTALLAMLRGEPSRYDRDGMWKARDWRLNGTADTFDTNDLLNAVVAIPFLFSHLPARDPGFRRIPVLFDKVMERLQNPDLLLVGGSPTLRMRDEEATEASKGAWVVVDGYLSFRPAKLTGEHRAFLHGAVERHYPNEVWPFSGCYPALEVLQRPTFIALVERARASPLVDGQWEIDPLASAPALVERVSSARSLSTDAARLFLQVLTLADCTDALLLSANGWAKPRLKSVGQSLVEKGLLTAEKRPRAARTFSLPGVWDAFKPPHPAMERWKLSLYDATCEEKHVLAPLGRVYPLRPVHELFAEAWTRWQDESKTARSTARPRGEWLSAITATRNDDLPRLVYADWLEEQGDPRGRFIQLQCELAKAPSPTLEAECGKLLEAHGAKWLEKVHGFIEEAQWRRGFVAGITASGPVFAKGAATVFAEEPLIERFTFAQTINAAQVRELASCAEFARFTELDTGGENYFSRLEFLETLLASPHFPTLRWLRLAFHRPGEGLSGALVDALIENERLSQSLRFLELQGQNLGRGLETGNHGFANVRYGTRWLERLLEGLPVLETLRVPYNGFTSVDAKDLAKRLEQGFAPALVTLDFSNRIEQPFVTKVVQWNHNTVSEDAQHRLDVVLAARKGLPLPEAMAAAPTPPKKQSERFPFVERAKSGRSKCVVCSQPIAEGELRLGIERAHAELRTITAWLHVDCRATCAELMGMTDVDERLARNSRGLWPQ